MYHARLFQQILGDIRPHHTVMVVKVQLNKLSKAATVMIGDSPGVAKGLQYCKMHRAISRGNCTRGGQFGIKLSNQVMLYHYNSELQ